MVAGVTGVDADLATLHPGTREFLSEYADRLATKGYPVHAQEIRKVLSWADGAEAELSRLREVEESFKHLSSEYQFDMDRGDHLVYREEWERFDRWQRLRDTLEEVDFVGAEGFAADMVAAAQAEASRLREERDALQHRIDCADTPLMQDVLADKLAAEARCARLQQALDGACDAAIWLTGLGEIPVDSAWPDEMRPKLNAAIAVAREALAGPDTLTAGEPGVGPDGTGRVATADGCAERQSTADPSPAASAGPDKPADSQEDKT